MFGVLGIYIVYIFSLSLFAQTIGKIGTRKSLYLSSILFFIAVIPLFTINNENRFLNYFIWILISGIAKSFYFVPYHYSMVKLTEEKNKGNQYSQFLLLSVLATLITPFFGGVLATTFGVKAIALVSGLIFASSIISLNGVPNYKFSFVTSVFKIIKQKGFLKNIKMSLLYQIQNQESFWQIYVFLLLNKNFFDFGMIFTIVNILGFLITQVLGKFLDHKNKLKILKLDGIVNGIIWFLRFLVSNALGVVLADSLFKINSFIKDETYYLIHYDLLNRETDELTLDEKIILRELVIAIFSALSIPLLLIIANIFNIQTVFIVAAIASILFTII